MKFVRSPLFQRAGVQLLWNVFERRNIVVSQVCIQKLTAVVVSHLLEQRLPQPKDRRPFELQLAQARIHDPAREDMGTQVKNPDLAGFNIDFHLATDRPLVPVYGADSLSGFQVEATTGAECAPTDKVALTAAQRNLTVTELAAGSPANRDSALFNNQVANGCFEQLGSMVEQLLLEVGGRLSDGTSHGKSRATGTRLLIIGRQFSVWIRHRHATHRYPELIGCDLSQYGFCALPELHAAGQDIETAVFV